MTPMATIVLLYPKDADPAVQDRAACRVRQWALDRGYAPCINFLSAELFHHLELQVEREPVEEAALLALAAACDDCRKPWESRSQAYRITHEVIQDAEAGRAHIFKWSPRPYVYFDSTPQKPARRWSDIFPNAKGIKTPIVGPRPWN